jgi:hypothetical protein
LNRSIASATGIKFRKIGVVDRVDNEARELFVVIALPERHVGNIGHLAIDYGEIQHLRAKGTFSQAPARRSGASVMIARSSTVSMVAPDRWLQFINT